MRTNAALLWDESFLWGLMAYKALKNNNLDFEMVSSGDIRNGCLEDYNMLFVPGGWASNKLKTLGDEGVAEIKKFVQNGGNYLGFCGGAGLATLDGIGLLNIRRRPTKERVPSFSGRIGLNIKGHPLFSDLPLQRFAGLPVFQVWWPSQFIVDGRDVEILATYAKAMPDAFSSDLNVGDVDSAFRWDDMEKIYGINLDPDRLLNDPALVEGLYGKGKVMLSLVHFDTPDDENGAAVLKNLWEYLSEQQNSRAVEQQPIEIQNSKFKIQNSKNCCATALLRYCAVIEASVDELINLGIRNFLWFWRNPMLLQWRRGVRGLEYCTLYVMVKEIASLLSSSVAEQQSSRHRNIDDCGFRSLENHFSKIKELLFPFVKKAKQLLILERYAMQNGYITPLSPPLLRGGWGGVYDPEIQKIRAELFGGSKSHGGLFKELISEVDNLLYSLLTASF